MQPASPTYILTWLSDTGAVEIVGPFASDVEAVVYGEAWQASHDDNPCWQALPRMDGSMPQITVLTAADARAALAAAAAPSGQSA